MSGTRTISIVAIFTSLIIATDFGLAQFPNVKLEDTLIFSSAYAFGWKIGLGVAVLSELIWGIASPYGFGGAVIPFLVVGETVYVAGGAIASRIWGREIKKISIQNFFFGAIVAICAFLFDIETNVFTSVVGTGHLTLIGALATVATGAWFMVAHELADFVLGAYLAPVAIVCFLRKFPLGRVEFEPVQNSIGA
ncbi:MAG: hypothetical protein ACRECH_14320 [Nitrososphaerales archaeon]